MDTVDTIAALCTGAGGAISIIRISGADALSVGNSSWKGRDALSAKNARKMLLGKLRNNDGSSGEPAIAVFMPGPKSYTGDNIVEIQCHGGALCSKRALDIVLANGARMAEPGEFTYRAFINGKMDLTQAEAVADMISAHSDMALHVAERQMSGYLKVSVESVRSELSDILAECESRMDFPEEDLDWAAPEDLKVRIEHSAEKIRCLLSSKTEGVVLRNGIRVVIAGEPNVGKSSLLNLLLGFDRAIVTELPGTTRDTLEEFANIRNIPVKLIDTAGLREADNLIEGMGIDRSRKSIMQAQIVLWLLDSSCPAPEKALEEMRKHVDEKTKAICVWNKSDIASDKKLPDTAFPSVRISVKTGEGIDSLLKLFEEAVWGFPHTEEPDVAVSGRHGALLEEALFVLPDAVNQLMSTEWELAAVHLRSAINSLGCITGKTSDPDVLENIFSRFCIGK